MSSTRTGRPKRRHTLSSTLSSSARLVPQPASRMIRRAVEGRRYLTGIGSPSSFWISIRRSSEGRRSSSTASSSDTRGRPRYVSILPSSRNCRFQARDVVIFTSRSPSTTSAPTSFAASIAARNSAPGVVPSNAPTSVYANPIAWVGPDWNRDVDTNLSAAAWQGFAVCASLTRALSLCGSSSNTTTSGRSLVMSSLVSSAAALETCAVPMRVTAARVSGCRSVAWGTLAHRVSHSSSSKRMLMTLTPPGAVPNETPSGNGGGGGVIPPSPFVAHLFVYYPNPTVPTLLYRVLGSNVRGAFRARGWASAWGGGRSASCTRRAAWRICRRG